MKSRTSSARPLTTHKRRRVWYCETTAWPYREPTAEQLRHGLDPRNQPESVDSPPPWESVSVVRLAEKKGGVRLR